MLLVAVLARAAVLALNVIALACLNGAVRSFVALLALAPGQRMRWRAIFAAATVLTLGEAWALLYLATFADKVVYAYA